LKGEKKTVGGNEMGKKLLLLSAGKMMKPKNEIEKRHTEKGSEGGSECERSKKNKLEFR
jgi:hypothetical protein